jgi:hypothetical protein
MDNAGNKEPVQKSSAAASPPFRKIEIPPWRSHPIRQENPPPQDPSDADRQAVEKVVSFIVAAMRAKAEPLRNH